MGRTMHEATAVPYTGAVDEVAVYDHALHAAEVATHANYAAMRRSVTRVAVGFGTEVRASCPTCSYTYADTATPTKRRPRRSAGRSHHTVRHALSQRRLHRLQLGSHRSKWRTRQQWIRWML